MSAMPGPLAYDPEVIVEHFLSADRRLLLFGESGIGKSTLAAELAHSLARAGRPCHGLGADPGSPAFGAPGTVCLATWQDQGWQALEFEALCTLDGGRFRLPLVSAVTRLGRNVAQGVLLVDAPGVVRGVAGAELLAALVEAAAIDMVLVLARHEKKLPLANELASLACQVVLVEASAQARHPGPGSRDRQRTHLWNAYLQQARERTIALAPEQLTGTPPPLPAGREWLGRQIALLRKGQTLAIGEVVGIGPDGVQARIAAIKGEADQILLRDAQRNSQGLLATVKPATAMIRYMPPPDLTPSGAAGKSTGPLPVARIGEATAVLVNGIFGDPLLHLRLHNRTRSILFDLGEGTRLSGRLAHQVSDVFISHAHIDHICGFLWLLRSRIGDLPTCRLFGPPGLSDHIAGLISGIHWDRIGERGPRFTVAELHGQRLILHAIQAGRAGKKLLGEQEVADGLLLDDPAFRVRVVPLGHGAIPVLAYALEQRPQLHVRKERLRARNLAPGPWLGELKRCLEADKGETPIRLPDGSSATAATLGADLILVRPGPKLAYSTDLSDNPANRARLTGLARGAHTLFCEAAFTEADRSHAEASGHLTARGCGEIASAAQVERLVPFHLSRRYEKNPLQIYDEVRSACQRVVLPKSSELLP